MAWKIYWSGLVILIADRREHHKTNPSATMRADGTACLLQGAKVSYDLGRAFLESFGARILSDKLSRVDLALDLPGVAIDPLFAAWIEQRYITLAKGRGMRESEGVSVYVGLGELKLRIYDKIAELESTGDGLKMAAMIQRRWGGKKPSHATRVEFELHRKPLTKAGIDSVADYFERRGDLVRYLVDEWVRFTEGKVDRRHTDRAKTLPLWNDIALGFQAWAGEPAGLALDPLAKGSIDLSAYFKQIVGLAIAAAVKEKKEIENVEEFLRYVLRNIRDLLDDDDLRDRFKERGPDMPG